MLERTRPSLVSGVDLRNAAMQARDSRRNISRAPLFGADEMRPIVFLPNWQRVATGGVSSPARMRHAPGMELSPRNRLLYGGAINCALWTGWIPKEMFYENCACRAAI
ncbi:hypothetical protein [Allomesorhizobium camelthorni]|uniref:Uncharacterized protein n=1 Tax=Allomesorhizobium camelthorni TaxID=475069 RepID=A0A6G4WBC3_9HYPH|nr:hypothetical protein [Mesorhizobium camelthorni]NGO51440.1 hypothetical protein [Mesorhizobium camelthorni]